MLFVAQQDSLKMCRGQEWSSVYKRSILLNKCSTYKGISVLETVNILKDQNTFAGSGCSPRCDILIYVKADK